MSHVITRAEVFICHSREEIESLAQTLANAGGTITERRLKLDRIEHIKTAMFGQEMLPFIWSKATVTGQHTDERVNGQHTTTMFCEMNEEEWAQVPYPVYIYYTEFECPTEHDVIALFEQYDPKESTRSQPDIMGVHLNAEPELRGRIADPETALALTSGLTWYEHRVLGIPPRKRGKFEIVHSPNPRILQFLQYCGTFLEKSKAREMLRPPIVAAMYHTIQDNIKVEHFWREVSQGKPKLEGGTIAYKLAEFLEQYRRGDHAEWPPSIRRKLGRTRKVAGLDAFATCLHAASFVVTGKVLGDVFVAAERQSARDLIEEFFPYTAQDSPIRINGQHASTLLFESMKDTDDDD